MKKLICFIVTVSMLISTISVVIAANSLNVWTLRYSSSSENGLFGATYGNGTFMVTHAQHLMEQKV